MRVEKIIIMNSSEITSKKKEDLFQAGCTTYIPSSESVFCYIDQLEEEAQETKSLRSVVKKAKAFAKAQAFNESDCSQFKFMILL